MFYDSVGMSKRLYTRIMKGVLRNEIWAIKWVAIAGHWQYILIKTRDVYNEDEKDNE